MISAAVAQEGISNALLEHHRGGVSTHGRGLRSFHHPCLPIFSDEHLRRVAGSTRGYLTPYGLKVSLFLTRLHARLLRPGFAALEPENPSSIPHPLRAALHRVDQEIQHMLENARLLAKAA